MNTQKIAAALIALAHAIHPTDEAASAPTDQTEGQSGVVKLGRPRKAAAAAASPAAPSAAPVQAAPAAAVDAGPATQVNLPPDVIPAQSNAAPPPGTLLTHAQVAPDFVLAGKTHGREFVVGLMKTYGAAMYDKVPKEKLAAFRKDLQAGPQPKEPAPDSVEDLLA